MRMGACELGVVLVVCLAAVASAQNNRVTHWEVDKYPDPFSYDSFSLCNRNNKSEICDPSGIILRREADEIDGLIKSVFRETRCGCPECTQKSMGYVIRVALMPHMASIFKEGNSTQAKLRDAQMFSYILTRRWSMASDCNAALIILYSRYDGILYTLTLSGARNVLDDGTIVRITQKVRPLFDDAATVAEGLKEMILRYKMVLNNDKENALKPRFARQRSNNASTVSASLALVSMVTLAAHWATSRH